MEIKFDYKGSESSNKFEKPYNTLILSRNAKKQHFHLK